MLLLLGLIALLAAKLNGRAPVEALTGKAYVIDGDTISIAGNLIRLKGIDAPELAQSCGSGAGPSACGQLSRQALVRLVGGREVRCDAYGRDKYNRSLATCYAGEINLNRAMIEAGQAVAYGDYHDAEAQARGARIGLWSSSFETPQDWRKDHAALPEEERQHERGRGADLFGQFLDWLKRLLGG